MYSGKCSPAWETAVHRPHTCFASNYLKPHQPIYWLTYTSTFYLCMFYLVSLSVARTVWRQTTGAQWIRWGPGLTWGVNAKFAWRDWLKILEGSIVCPWPWIWTGNFRNTKHWQTLPCLLNFRLTHFLTKTGNVRINATMWRARMTIVVMLKQEVLRNL